MGKGNGERKGRKINLNGHQETKHELLRHRRSVGSSASRETAVVKDGLPVLRLTQGQEKVLREHKEELKGKNERHQEEGRGRNERLKQTRHGERQWRNSQECSSRE